jgi:hypothetical protein
MFIKFSIITEIPSRSEGLSRIKEKEEKEDLSRQLIVK